MPCVQPSSAATQQSRARPTRLHAGPSLNGDALLRELTAVPLADLSEDAIDPYASRAW